MESSGLIGSYYVKLLDAHIRWKRNTESNRNEEGYLKIPAKYAYAFQIVRGKEYKCYSVDNKKTFKVKASGTQNRREYAKQFQGSGDLGVFYKWYLERNAREGDYVVVRIYKNDQISVEYISQDEIKRLRELGIRGESGKTNTESNYKNEPTFRLVSMSAYLGTKIAFQYDYMPKKYTDNKETPFVTIMVGANGTGKSYALRTLADILYSVENKNVLKNLPMDRYYLNYSLRGNNIEIEIINKTVMVHRNGELIEHNLSSVLPESVLAISYMVNDKFPYCKESSDKKGGYKYLGLRNSSNAVYTGSLENKVIENLITLVTENRLMNGIDSLSRYLGFDSKLVLVYSFNSLNKLNSLSYHEIVESLNENEKKEIPPSFENFIDKCRCDNRIQNELIIEEKRTIAERKALINDFESLKILKNLNIISYALCFYKNSEEYYFESTSSGEKHIIYTILNLARHIREYSLVLIDEPENGLHPNWQMQYVSLLKSVFKKYSSSQIVLATHSPYLVSDLEPGSSSLITLREDDEGYISETVDYSTYAWSVENILYNVFKVRTVRNFYFEKDLEKLIKMIQDNHPHDEMYNKLVNKLSKYTFDEADPLVSLLDNAKGL